MNWLLIFTPQMTQPVVMNNLSAKCELSSVSEKNTFSCQSFS